MKKVKGKLKKGIQTNQHSPFSFIRKEFERSVRERMEKEWTEKETSLRAQFTRERDQVRFQSFSGF